MHKSKQLLNKNCGEQYCIKTSRLHKVKNCVVYQIANRYSLSSFRHSSFGEAFSKSCTESSFAFMNNEDESRAHHISSDGKAVQRRTMLWVYERFREIQISTVSKSDERARSSRVLWAACHRCFLHRSRGVVVTVVDRSHRCGTRSGTRLHRIVSS